MSERKNSLKVTPNEQPLSPLGPHHPQAITTDDRARAPTSSEGGGSQANYSAQGRGGSPNLSDQQGNHQRGQQQQLSGTGSSPPRARQQTGGSGPPASSSSTAHHPRPPPPMLPYASSYTGRDRGPRSTAGMIVESPTGGMQVTLDGGASWSDLARQDATLPADAASGDGSGAGGSAGLGGGQGNKGGGGVLGFLSRKKGRASSPGKPKERGVLGKEGARVVIG